MMRPKICAFRRSASPYISGGEHVGLAWQNSDADASRERLPFPPPRSGGGGPLELAQRANRGGGGAGREASFSLQEILAARRSERANMFEHHCDSYVALSPAPPPPPCCAGWSPSPAIAGADEARPLRGDEWSDVRGNPAHRPYIRTP